MIQTKDLNDKQRGNYGLASAIEFFASRGYTVSVPLTDTQKYDLVVEIDGVLAKVQVKTTTKKTDYGSWSVQLKNTSIRKKGPTVIQKFDNTLVDYLFVVTSDGDRYWIPADAVAAKCELCINKDFDLCKVGV